MSDGRLWIWVIYDHPSDFPDMYVARAQRILADGSLEVDGTAFASPKLEDLRAYMEAKHLVRMARHDEDDPVILETWI